MKRLTMAALALALMTSCAKEEATTQAGLSDTAVTFSAGALTRVTSDGADYWEADDYISISTSEISPSYSNVKYVSDLETGETAPTTGFEYVSGGEILLPNAETGSAIFNAFYPYYVVGENSLIEVSVADQKENGYGSVDFMTASTSITYGSSSSEEVVFNFVHKLAKVIIEVGLNDNLSSLKGLTASISGVYEKRGYDIAGELNRSLGVDKILTSSLPLTTNVVGDETNGYKTATVTAILHPMDATTDYDDIKDAKITFTVDEDNRTFSVGFAKTLTAGSVHKYYIDLGNDYPVFKSGSTISSWNGEDDDATELIPDL